MRAETGSDGTPPQELAADAAGAHKPAAIIVAGPTCSGKSTLALALASRIGGTIINADSMQVYAELRVLTARPTPADEGLVPHALYGIRSAAEPGSVGWWRAVALDVMAAARAAGRVPILCGGTGLYLSALTQGLAEIPDPGPRARAEARALLAAEGAEGLHRRLAQLDPEGAARLRPSDGQRIARAYEVAIGTGRTLADWQAAAALEPAPWRFAAIRLDPPRPALRAAIAGRFAAMLEQGALEEARALLALGLDPSLPAMRAHGVPELASHLAGEITLDEAAVRTTAATSQYAKRQTTWWRHHNVAAPAHTHTIYARYATQTKFSETIPAKLLAFVDAGG
jgi:tRNA dimethylallyltransferase